MPSSFIHVVAKGRVSFLLWLSNISYIYLSIHGHLDYIFAVMNNIAVNMGVKILFKTVILSDKVTSRDVALLPSPISLLYSWLSRLSMPANFPSAAHEARQRWISQRVLWDPGEVATSASGSLLHRPRGSRWVWHCAGLGKGLQGQTETVSLPCSSGVLCSR